MRGKNRVGKAMRYKGESMCFGGNVCGGEFSCVLWDGTNNVLIVLIYKIFK